jgi:hypothetical protein
VTSRGKYSILKITIGKANITTHPGFRDGLVHYWQKAQGIFPGEPMAQLDKFELDFQIFWGF